MNLGISQSCSSTPSHLVKQGFVERIDQVRFIFDSTFLRMVYTLLVSAWISEGMLEYVFLV